LQKLHAISIETNKLIPEGITASPEREATPDGKDVFNELESNEKMFKDIL
jgi:hypothetical protein